MQTVMNLKIKYRESFRPFAPAIKADKVQEWFQLDSASPYMLIVAQVDEGKLTEPDSAGQSTTGLDRLKLERSEIPAVTHVDCSARVQTVHPETNPQFYRLLDEFEQLTACPLLVNTSFNVRGEPIVNTPEDAYRCFMRTEMDYLVMGNYLLAKTEQPRSDDDGAWRQEFELD
jgi:carbamoyltransferase